MSRVIAFQRVAIVLLAAGVMSIASPADGQARNARTKTEVDALIAQAGSSTPDWWDTTELDYPETLDLNWPVRAGFGPGRFEERGGRDRRGGRGRRGGGGFGWEQSPPTNVDEYLIQVVYPNPSRHKAGVKLVHHLMIRHKDDPEKLRRSLNTLGEMFYELFGEYARAAFWWQKCAALGGGADALKVARCYFELGSPATAADLLSQAGSDEARNTKDAIKLWARIGEVDKALSMIESYGGAGNPGTDRFGFRGRRSMSQSSKYLLAAEICRGAGRYDEALAYYAKVLALPNSETRPADHHETDDKFEAQVNRTGTEFLRTLDLTRVPDGSYTETVEAYGGPMTVQVVVRNRRIASVEVTRHQETYEYLIMAQPTARQIGQKQGFEGVDVITGATVTSDAIINAAAAALAKAME